MVSLIATWFGTGRLSRRWPGTIGTLATVPLAALLFLAHGAALVSVAVAMTLVGVWAAGRHAERLGVKDPREVVIDEVAGYLWACCGGAPTWPTLIVAFFAFRVLDIVKPWPIRAAERLPGGWGIVMDDVLAGLLSAVVVWLAWGGMTGDWTRFLEGWGR